MSLFVYYIHLADSGFPVTDGFLKSCDKRKLTEVSNKMWKQTFAGKNKPVINTEFSVSSMMDGSRKSQLNKIFEKVMKAI